MHIVLLHNHGCSQPTLLTLVCTKCNFRNVTWYIPSIFTYLLQPMVVSYGDVAVYIVLYQRHEHHVQGAHVPYIIQVNYIVSAHQSEKGVVKPCHLLLHLIPKVLNPLQPQ